MKLFYCNGLIPLILASAYKEKLFSSENCHLILELPKTRVFRINEVNLNSLDHSYFQIVRMFSRATDWKSVDFFELDTTFVLYSLKFDTLNRLFPANLRFIKNRKRTIKELRALLKSFPIGKQVFVSDNCLLSREIFSSEDALVSIEHGASSYLKPSAEFTFKRALRKILCKLRIIPNEIEFKTRLYSDNESVLTKSLNGENGGGYIANSIDVREEIRDYFKKVELIYKETFPIEFKELETISQRLGRQQLCLYLPTGIIDSENYGVFLKSQMEMLDPKNILFLIKPHPNDTARDYGSVFRDMNLEAITLKCKLNQNLPAEFLLYFFSGSILFGTKTSAHMYSQFWLEQKSIVTHVADEKCRKIIDSEYSCVDGFFNNTRDKG